MGMYDTVWVNCPNCNKYLGFQTKGGECYLSDYELDNAPKAVMSDVNRHSPLKCECGNKYEVDISTRKLKQIV